MSKFNVTVGCEYVMGHLRYGHYEGIVEADTEEEAIKKAKDEIEYFDLVIDDYEIEDAEVDLNGIYVEKIN